MPSSSDPIAGSVWIRPPRSRGEQPTLGREQIVRAAIELLDAEGLAGLSMRRLGSKLGSGATSVYWYVANKDELLELAIDEVMGEVYMPELGDTSWRIAASVFTTGMRSMLLRHPWVIGLFGVRANIGPNSMRNADRAVAVLAAAGFSGMELAHASSLLMSHAIGSAMTVSAAAATSKQAGRPVNEIFKELEPYLERIAPDHPNYHKWWHESGAASIDPEQLWDEGFMFGLERLLDGLDMWLAQPKH
jgi:AcrR family transcriptional regulator